MAPSSKTLRAEAVQGNADAVTALLIAGADVSIKNMRGATPLHAAALMGHTVVVAKLLEDTRVKVNAADIRGTIPLHSAVRKGQQLL